MKQSILYVVSPCYNEEEVLNETVKRLTEKFQQMIYDEMISGKSRIMLVNDGSKDGTWSIIKKLYHDNEFVTGLNLSRNRGHQNALLAGLMTAKEYADAIVSMDADLQDDINALDGFMRAYENGYEVVYGVRKSRKTDTFFKRNTALMFYKIMQKMGVEIVYNHADYRLMSKRAVEGLSEFQEVNLFLRGIVPMIGFPSTVVEYERNERFAGESKYPLKKMISFALDGITSCSIKPIRCIMALGFGLSFVSVLFLLYIIISYFLKGDTVAGWATLTVLISLFGSVQIFCIGVIGEYIGKIYNETKSRPRFIIQEELIK